MKMVINLSIITAAMFLSGCVQELSEQDCKEYSDIANTMMSANQYGIKTEEEVLSTAELSNDERVVTIAKDAFKTSARTTQWWKEKEINDYTQEVYDRCMNDGSF